MKSRKATRAPAPPVPQANGHVTENGHEHIQVLLDDIYESGRPPRPSSPFSSTSSHDYMSLSAVRRVSGSNYESLTMSPVNSPYHHATLPSTGSHGRPLCLSHSISSQPLSYTDSSVGDDASSDTEDQELTLDILLPTGEMTNITVEPAMPIMDLLVQVARRARLNPANHKIIIPNPDDPNRCIDFKANQTVGSLGVTFLQLVDKVAQREATLRKAATLRTQPFEMTYRMAINLPENRKMVIRVNPQTPLIDVFDAACKQHGLDITKYNVYSTQMPGKALALKKKIEELQINEITLVPKSSDIHQSLPDLRDNSKNPSATVDTKSGEDVQPGADYMPSEPKKKKSRWLSFFSKKDRKLKLNDRHNSELNLSQKESVSSRNSTSSVPSDAPSTETPKSRPVTMYASFPDTSQESNGTKNGTTPVEKIKSKSSLKKSSSLEVGNSVEKSSGLFKRAKDKKKRAAPKPPESSETASDVNESIVADEVLGGGEGDAVVVHHADTGGDPSSNVFLTSDNKMETVESDTRLSADFETPLNGSLLTEIQNACTDKEIVLDVELVQSDSKPVLNDKIDETINAMSHKPHSRNSSDSSGYHEATMSETGSPEVNRTGSLQNGEVKVKNKEIKSDLNNDPNVNKSSLNEITFTDSTSLTSDRDILANNDRIQERDLNSKHKLDTTSPAHTGSTNYTEKDIYNNNIENNLNDQKIERKVDNDDLSFESIPSLRVARKGSQIESQAEIPVLSSIPDNHDIDETTIPLQKTGNRSDPRPCAFVPPPPPPDTPPPLTQTSQQVVMADKTTSVTADSPSLNIEDDEAVYTFPNSL